MPLHIAHLRHQLKDVFEKYDMRDKDGKQDGKLLHEEVRTEGRRGRGKKEERGEGRVCDGEWRTDLSGFVCVCVAVCGTTRGLYM